MRFIEARLIPERIEELYRCIDSSVDHNLQNRVFALTKRRQQQLGVIAARGYVKPIGGRGEVRLLQGFQSY